MEKTVSGNGKPPDKKGVKRRKISFQFKLYFCLWLVFALTFSFAIILELDKLKTFQQEKLEIMAQIEQQKAENSSLRREMEYYDTDAYIERIAREELGFVSPNETVFYNSTK